LVRRLIVSATGSSPLTERRFQPAFGGFIAYRL